MFVRQDWDNLSKKRGNQPVMSILYIIQIPMHGMRLRIWIISKKNLCPLSPWKMKQWCISNKTDICFSLYRNIISAPVMKAGTIVTKENGHSKKQTIMREYAPSKWQGLEVTQIHPSLT